MTQQKTRNQALDALRGLAILAMVLSSSIAFGILPGWMYHAQEPPPSHGFRPEIPGISWVDLVFPFFLFSMGAAIPLALGKKAREGKGTGTVLYTGARRWMLLVFFAFFTVHMRASTLSGSPGAGTYLLSLFAFVLLALQFYQPASVTGSNAWIFRIVRILAYVAGLALLYFLPFNDGKGFDRWRIDIIILILGNMAFFGTLVWWFTRNQPWARIAILPFLMAVLLGAGAAPSGDDLSSGTAAAASLNHWLYYWSPFPWMYKFYYLKYLFIIIPGTLAGDWLMQYEKSEAGGSKGGVEEINEGVSVGASVGKAEADSAGRHETKGRNKVDSEAGERLWMRWIAALSLAMVICNVICLYSRLLLLNLGLSAALGILLYTVLQPMGKETSEKTSLLLGRFFRGGAYLLALGLFFEAYEGGIRKDYPTYSYYLVSSGLAFFMLMALFAAQLSGAGNRLVNFLGLNGRNPMVAYTAGNLLLIPVLHLSGGMALFDRMGGNIWLGVARGLLFTALVALVTIFFTRRKWFWKT